MSGVNDIDRLRRLALEGDRKAAWALAREAVQRQDEALLALASDALGGESIRGAARAGAETVARLLGGALRRVTAHHSHDAIDALEQALQGRATRHPEQAPPTIAEVYEQFAAAAERNVTLTEEDRARAFSREVVRQAAVVTPGWREELGGWALEQLGAPVRVSGLQVPVEAIEAVEWEDES